MANRPAQFRQKEATAFTKAAAAAGYGRTRILIHPDGVIEYVAEIVEAANGNEAENEWNEVLK